MIDLIDLRSGVWEALRKKKPSNHEMAATEQIADRGQVQPFTCICFSRDQTAHLMIEIGPRLRPSLKPISLAGLNISVLEDHLIRPHGRRRLIDVKCSSTAHIPAFTSVVNEIAVLVLRNRVAPALAVDQTIKKWKSFWGKPASSVLNIDEQLGLIGEMSFMHLLMQEIGVGAAIDAWRGPLGFRYDFVLKNNAVEIKTSQRPHRHTVNGIEQLESKQPLLLVSWGADLVENGGTSVPDEIRRIEAEIREFPEAHEKFQRLIVSAGYRPEHREIYLSNRFTVTDGRVYSVDGQFPRLVPSMLKHRLSARITNLRYDIEIDGLEFKELSSWMKELAKKK